MNVDRKGDLERNVQVNGEVFGLFQNERTVI